MKCIYKNRLKKIINLLQKADLDEKFGKIQIEKLIKKIGIIYVNG